MFHITLLLFLLLFYYYYFYYYCSYYRCDCASIISIITIIENTVSIIIFRAVVELYCVKEVRVRVSVGTTLTHREARGLHRRFHPPSKIKSLLLLYEYYIILYKNYIIFIYLNYIVYYYILYHNILYYYVILILLLPLLLNNSLLLLLLFLSNYYYH